MTKEELYARVEPEYIFRWYLGFFSYRKAFKSPFRPDKSPDCFFFKSKSTGEPIFHDFAQGEGYDSIKIVQKLFNLNYREALEKIAKDMLSDVKTPHIVNILPSDAYLVDDFVDEKVNFIYELKRWNKKEYQYWLDYGITAKSLRKYHVRSCNWIGVNNRVMFTTFDDCPIFIYEFGEDIKMYRPLTKERKNKWRQNVRENTVQGLEQLPEKGKILIITKSLKDVMVLDELGYNAIAPISESTRLSKELITDLKKRFKRIYVIMDNDKTGQKAATYYFDNFNIPYFFIEEEKDVSDYSKKFGIEKLKQKLKLLIV